MEQNNLELFEHEEFGQVRVVMIDGNPWFIANDLERILELTNIRQNLAALDDDERGVCNIYARGGTIQPFNIVNEPGLYHLIFMSHTPEAKKFRKWVTHEVLPSIRKTGAYFIGNPNPIGYNDTTPGADFWWEVKPKHVPTDFERGLELKKLAIHAKDPDQRQRLIGQAAELIMRSNVPDKYIKQQRRLIAEVAELLLPTKRTCAPLLDKEINTLF